MADDKFNLTRFVSAQANVYDEVCAELRAACKRTHWMWFVFPQLRGLGHSSTALFYGLGDEAEARAYWQHPLLGPRLKSCVDFVLAAPPAATAHGIFGSPDDLKLHSCLTLFGHVAPEEPCFRSALDRYFEGRADHRTLALLAQGEGRA